MKLTRDEISASIDGDRYPPILTPKQAAELLQVSLPTIYRWSSEDRYSLAIRRGRPLRIWRDRLIEQFFSDPGPRRRLRRTGRSR